MFKKLFVLFLLITLASCSGFFDQEKIDRDGIGISALALSDGSGYISTDEFNEITPYVFNDTNTGKKWLLFSSDRDGSFDIYYSEIDSEGKCSRLVKMSNTINMSGDEISPALFRAYYNNGMLVSLFLSYLCVSNGATTVYTCRLDSNLNIAGPVQSSGGTGFTRISVLGKDNLDPRLMIANGMVGWREDNWNNGGAGTWYNEASSHALSNMNQAVISVDGYRERPAVEYYIYWHVFSALVDGKKQIFAGAYDTDDANNYYRVIPYLSQYNDKDPVIDEADKKIYFASDRYGKGNYDLYRYNYLTYSVIQNPLLEKPVIQDPGIYDLVEPQPVNLSWNTINGATHYLVFRCIDNPYNETNDLIGVTGETNMSDPWVTNGTYYYYRVQAVGPFGVSGASYYVGDQYAGAYW